jgi:hypothetical protein
MSTAGRAQVGGRGASMANVLSVLSSSSWMCSRSLGQSSTHGGVQGSADQIAFVVADDLDDDVRQLFVVRQWASPATALLRLVRPSTSSQCLRNCRK